MSSKRLQSSENGASSSNRCSKKHDLKNNYNPLEVGQEYTSTACPVNHVRTIINERKTILYGQTPPAMCRIQFGSMAEAVGMTGAEFARHVMATKTKEHLQLLRQFYTRNLPQVTQLFDELYICTATESPLQRTVRGIQTESTVRKNSNDEASIVDEAGARPGKESIPDDKTNTENDGKIAENLGINNKKCCKTEEKFFFTKLPTLNSNSSQDVLEMNFVLDEDIQNEIKENITREDFTSAGKWRRDKSKATSSSLTLKNRIFVPNKKGETNEITENSNLLDDDDITCSSIDLEKQPTQIVDTLRKVKSQCSKNSLISTSSEIQSLSNAADNMVLSTSVYGQETKATEKRCVNLTHGQNITPPITSEQNSKMGSSDYNTFLVGLLFKDDMTTTCVDKTKCFKNQALRNNSHNESSDLNYIHSEKTKLCKDDRAMKSKTTEQYNKVLDTLLFGESSSVLESDPEQNDMVATSISPTQLSNASSQANHSYNPSKHSRHIIDELFDS